MRLMDPMRVFEDVERALFTRPTWTWAPPQAAPTWPTFDVEHTDEAVIVTADLPGLTEDDVSVSVAGRTLTIEGQSNRKRWRGAFSRQFSLAEGLDTDRVEAELRHGVLTVVVPKTDQARPRKIKLGSGVLDKVKGLLARDAS